MEAVNGKNKDPNKSYVPCNKNEDTFFGAQDVIEAEKQYLKDHRGKTESEVAAGLALSGGGIRSASFSLGVMQALAHKKWLAKVDYLSTVSGGGYIGSSLTWLLSKNWEIRHDAARKETVAFSTNKDEFPYAAYPMSGQAPNAQERISLASRVQEGGVRMKGRLLQFLRQNAKFLTPGSGINIFSLISVVLRGSVMSLLTYFGMLVVLFVLSDLLHQRFPSPFAPNWFLAAAFCALIFSIACWPIYSLGSFWLSQADGKAKNIAYYYRRLYEWKSGYLIPISLVLVVLGSVPLVHDWIIARSDALPWSGNALWMDMKAKAGDFGTDPLALGAGLFSLVIGIASGVTSFIKTHRIKTSKIPTGLYVSIGVAGLLFGLLLFAYSCAKIALQAQPVVLVVCFLVLAAFAFWVNINHMSVHRYYRDRLMETFMPDVAKVYNDTYERFHESAEANRTPLSAMCKRAGEKPGSSAYPGPYHIINTNAVLVSSRQKKFRGRGGDNFILSPAYCGSSATGWRRTSDYMNNTMSLASAMAISGAAVNPNAACGGDGITRQPFLSVLMGLLNFRLGYWVPNPRSRTDVYGVRVPNYILPGLCEILWRNQLHEDNFFLQLSDGGHFENLALYELVRRKLKLIIVCDGGADPNFTFGDLANAIEKVRTDFGALISIESSELKPLVPQGAEDSGGPVSVPCAKQAYLMAPIRYADNTEGRLLYLTTTFFKELSPDLYGYKKEHPSFPDEPTSDQFFNEKQFEAYRELGFQSAWRMMQDELVMKDSIVNSVMGQ